jgi:UDP-N-acetylglucosamine 1-carboxyvinyltransferase
MIAACFAKGKTRIFNANTRPEIVDMANLLNQLGADISVQNRVVEIEGFTTFTSEPIAYSVMSGWDEALLYMMAAGMTQGEVCIEGFTLDHIRQDVDYLRQAGLEVFQWGGNVYVSGKNKVLSSFDLFTAPYPGVNSDMQPLFAALAGICTGDSTITDQRFTDRFGYVSELRKLGVDINNYGNCAVVNGPSDLRSNEAVALDLRCGAALLLIALATKGTTTIDNCYQIYRGHEFVAERLRSLGADIQEQT